MQAVAAQLRAAAGFLHQRGYLDGHGARRAQRLHLAVGPRAVITDFGMLAPHPQTDELQLVALYPGVPASRRRAPPTGWPLRWPTTSTRCPAAHRRNSTTLRHTLTRTRDAHARPVHIRCHAEGLP